MNRLLPIIALLLASVACQQPFGADRHDLVDFRIVGVRADALDAGVHASAAIVVDGKPWSDEPVELRWYVLDPGDANAMRDLDPSTPPDASGPAPVLPPSTPYGLGLIAIAPSGEIQRAFLDVDPPDERLPLTTGLALGVIEGLTLDTVTAEDLPIEARRDFEPRSAQSVQPGELARVKVQFGAIPSTSPQARFTTNLGGSFFELDRVTTDWFAGSVELDDDEVIVGDPLAAGIGTFVAVVIGEGGDNRWAARDVAVGDRPTGLLTTSTRFIPADVDSTDGLYAVTLEADDASPTGLRAVSATPVLEEDLDDVDPYGTNDLCEGDHYGPFDPDWLLDQRCTRTAVIGHTVVIEAIP